MSEMAWSMSTVVSSFTGTSSTFCLQVEQLFESGFLSVDMVVVWWVWSVSADDPVSCVCSSFRVLKDTRVFDRERWFDNCTTRSLAMNMQGLGKVADFVEMMKEGRS